MMADDWVLPVAPLRLSVIIIDKAMLQALMVTLGAECVLAIATGLAVNGVDSSVHAQCVVAFKSYTVKLLSSETLVCVFVGSHLW